MDNQRLSLVERTLIPGVTLVFVFSGSRRHTRYIGDWSSDVCSSDLRFVAVVRTKRRGRRRRFVRTTRGCRRGTVASERARARAGEVGRGRVFGGLSGNVCAFAAGMKIGRASCRERVGGVGGGERGKK